MKSAPHRRRVLGARAARSVALTLLAGEQLVTWWRHADGGFEKGFCSRCGAHLFSRNPDDRAQLTVRMAAFDGDPGVRLGHRAWRTPPHGADPRRRPAARYDGSPPG